MSLLFGNLTQDFVNFTQAIQNINPNDPQSSAKVEETARGFRRVAAKDASYLTYIGKRNLPSRLRLSQSRAIPPLSMQAWECFSVLSST